MTCWENFTSIFSFKGNPQQSWRRFFVLAVFCLFSISNAVQWTTYSPIPTSSKALYKMTTAQLNMFSTIYMIVYVVLAVFSSLGVERLGLRPCMVIGTFLNFLGALLKLVCGFPSKDYGVIMAAQVINAFAQLFVLSVPPTIASIWFRDTERYTATAIGTVANALGCAIGVLLPPIWVKEEDLDPTDGFLKLYAFQFALTGGALLGSVFLVPTASAPTLAIAAGAETGDEAVAVVEGEVVDAAANDQKDPAPPAPGTVVATTTDAPANDANAVATTSQSGELVEAADPDSIKGIFLSLLELAKDWNCMVCVAALSISVGSVWATNSLLAQLLAPINISEADAGQMGFWNIIAGTIVAVFVGPLIDKFRVYKYPIIGLAVVNLVCLSFIIMIIYLDDSNIGDSVSSSSLTGIYFLNVFTGIPQNVLTPVGFEFLMELSFGHSGSVTGALLMAGANLVSLVEVTIGSALLGEDDVAPKGNALNAFWLIWAILVFGLILLNVPRNRLKRFDAENRAKAAAAAKEAATAAVAVGGAEEGADALPPAPGTVAAIAAPPAAMAPPAKAADADEANEAPAAPPAAPADPPAKETHPHAIEEDAAAFNAPAAPVQTPATQQEEPAAAQ